jgi:hypothetical protein
MRAQSKVRKLRFVKPLQADEPEVQQGRQYPHVTPGQYTGYCHTARTYFDRTFGRWVCFLGFDLMVAESGETIARGVPLWLSLGEGRRPRASRRSKYFAAWVQANGEGPRRHDRMNANVFRQRMATVKVADTRGPAVYSRISAIVSWETAGNTSS